MRVRTLQKPYPQKNNIEIKKIICPLAKKDDRQICFGLVKGEKSTSISEWEDRAKNVTQNEAQGDMYKIESNI